MCPGVDFDPTVWDGAYLWYKVSYNAADSYVYIALYNLEIKLLSLVFFSA